MHRFLTFALSFVLLASTTSAFAQPGTEAEYRAARAFIESERFDDAVAAYRALTERTDEARAFIGLAIALNFAGDPTAAATYIERALSRTGDPWLERNRASAEGYAVQFWPLVGRLVIVCDVPGAEVLVDGIVVGTTPMPAAGVVVASGERRVEVRSAAHEPFSVSLRIAPSDFSVTPEIQVTRRQVTLTPRAVRQVGRIMVRTNVDGAAIFVDETFVANAPLRDPLVVEPGERRIAIRAAGYAERFEVVTVPGGPESSPPEPVELTLELEESAVAAGSGSSGGVSPAVRYSLIGAGGLLLAGSGVTSAMWASAHSDLDSYCSFGSCVNTAASRDARDRFRALRLTSIVVGGAGVATLITGLVLPERAAERSPSVDVACDGTGCSATVGGRF